MYLWYILYLLFIIYRFHAGFPNVGVPLSHQVVLYCTAIAILRILESCRGQPLDPVMKSWSSRDGACFWYKSLPYFFMSLMPTVLQDFSTFVRQSWPVLNEVCINLIHVWCFLRAAQRFGCSIRLARLPCQGAIVNIKRMSQLIVTSPESFNGHGFRMCFLDQTRWPKRNRNRNLYESVRLVRSIAPGGSIAPPWWSPWTQSGSGT